MAVAAGNDDKLLQAISGMVPVEVIAAYNPLINIIPPVHVSLRFWITIAMIPITGLWIAFATADDNKSIAWRQVIIAPFAFACWTSAMQTEMLKGVIPTWEAWVGTVVVGLGTLLLPILNGILKRLGVPQN